MKDDGKAGGATGRLMSLDALRGFDMFFITGGAALITGLCAAFGCPDCWIATQMKHVPWAGLAHHDTIFPLFLFLAGVSWPFSLAAQEARGRTAWQIHRKVLVRALAFFLIELSFGGVLKFDPSFRLMGVLGFIGFSWGLAALLFLHVRKASSRAVLVGAALVGYWALLRFGVAPDAPALADTYSKEWNLVSYIDRSLWPTHLYRKGVYEPESLFSVTNGAALAFLGMCAGALLRSDRLAPARKSAALCLAGLGFAALAAAFVWLLGDQVVKALWTTSFVLSAAAYSSLMLALFHWLIDVKGWRGWTLYFRVIGMNSIFVYLMMRLGVLALLGRFLSEGLAGWAGTPWSAVVRALGTLAGGWLVLYLLYRKQAFLKV